MRLQPMPSEESTSPPGRRLGQARVLLAVGGRARAEELQGHGTRVEQLVAGTRRDQSAVALADDPLLAVDDQAPVAGGDEIQLLARLVVVLCRCPADREGCLSKALVLGGRGDAPRPLPDLRAVERDERLELSVGANVHRRRSLDKAPRVKRTRLSGARVDHGAQWPATLAAGRPAIIKA